MNFLTIKLNNDDGFTPVLLYVSISCKLIDGVARFHIANGAEIYRLNWMADPSSKGWRNSFGMMVNYRYNLETLHGNQAQYELDYSIPVVEGVNVLLA